MSINNFFWKS